MMNLRESLGWIYGQGAKIAGSKKALTNGYIFKGPEEKALRVFEAGGFYHLTINSFLDRKTGGRSSELQLGSLIANINLGQDLIDSDYIREP